MQRSRSFSRPNTPNRKPRSPSSTPRGRTPSPTPRGRAPSRPRPASFHPDTRSKSRVKTGSSSRSSSRSSSPSPTRRNRRPENHRPESHRPENHRHGGQSHSKDRNHHHHHHGLFKTTTGLLAGIGLATVLAHKVWPKGVLYGDSEEWESRPRSKHCHGHHHHHSRRSSDAERVIERAGRRRGEVVYYEEVGPLPRRRRSFGQSYDRLSPRPTEERIRREERVGRLPYPDAAYPGDRFYEPERRRSTVVPPVAMPR
ncbi:hypothetical protein ACJ41O_000640 [Fusarium nematophilum]